MTRFSGDLVEVEKGMQELFQEWVKGLRYSLLVPGHLSAVFLALESIISVEQEPETANVRECSPWFKTAGGKWLRQRVPLLIS